MKKIRRKPRFLSPRPGYWRFRLPDGTLLASAANDHYAEVGWRVVTQSPDEIV